MKTFVNPADYIIKLAQAPELCNLDLNSDALVHTYDKQLKPFVTDTIKRDTEKFSDLVVTFCEFAATRQIGCFKQFIYLYQRNR